MRAERERGGVLIRECGRFCMRANDTSIGMDQKAQRILRTG